MSRVMNGESRIDRAFVEEVVARGFPATTVEGVCARAGIERAAFEREYSDPEDAYEQIMKRHREEILAGALPAFAGASEWRSAIRAVAFSMVEFLEEDRTRAKFIFVESFWAGERVQILRDEAIAAVVELVDLGRQELDDPGSLSRATAEGVVGGIFNQVRAALERDEPDGYSLIPPLMYAAVQPYLGPDAALAELRVDTGTQALSR